METKIEKRPASFRLDAPTRKALELLANMERRSQATIIELAVEEYYLKHHEAELDRPAPVTQEAQS